MTKIKKRSCATKFFNTWLLCLMIGSIVSKYCQYKYNYYLKNTFDGCITYNFFSTIKNFHIDICKSLRNMVDEYVLTEGILDTISKIY